MFVKSNERYKYKGVIHIHSLYSDGTGDIGLITKSARQAGLEWIIITDHNNFDIEEGIINGITVIKGEEISPNDENHYLALGINKCINPNQDMKDTIKLVRENGGFGFAAHPDESDLRKNIYKPIKWTNKDIIPDGVEIWNWFSLWADNYNDTNFFTKAYSFLFKYNLVKRPCINTIKWWDKLNNKTKNIIPAIAGVDAHALKYKNYIIPLYIFPYKSLFKTFVNEIITDSPLSNKFEIRKEQILKAIKLGNNILINQKTNKIAPEIFIKNNHSKAFTGEFLYLDNNTYLYFNCNRKAKIKIYKNAIEIAELNSDRAEIKITKPGKYRVETEIKGIVYAYSNPIVVLAG